MKKYFLYTCTALLYTGMAVHGQGIKIMPGTTFRLTGGSYTMVLSGGADFENNAPVQLANLTLKATGNGANDIKGSAPLSIAKLELSKTPFQQVVLQKNLTVGNSVIFSNGWVNLNSYNLLLGDTAFLDSESENSRVMSTSSGAVQLTRVLNSPLAENPGNLGMIITSGANWGSTVIQRSHTPFVNGGGGSSIARSYSIVPTNNTGLSAFLRMYYFDVELNALNENALDFTQSNNGGANWNNIGSVSRNTVQNFVNINNIQQMSLFTLTPANNPLPLQLAYIESSCIHNRPEMHWKMANPGQVAYFIIQKSSDSRTWVNIGGSIPVNASVDYEYVFTDVSEPYPYYRLQSVDVDQTNSYSPVQVVNCKEETYSISLLQNPVRDVLRLGISAKAGMQTKIMITDMTGRVLLVRDLNIAAGDATVSYDVNSFAKGTYQVQVILRNEPIWQAKFVTQ